MAKRNTIVLLRAAMNKHGITSALLRERVQYSEQISAKAAADLVEQFESGTDCPVVVGAALIGLIAEKGVSDEEIGTDVS